MTNPIQQISDELLTFAAQQVEGRQDNRGRRIDESTVDTACSQSTAQIQTNTTQMKQSVNRVLIIDDNASILDVYRKIFSGTADLSTGKLDAMEAMLFATSAPSVDTRQQFEVVCFQDGEEACHHVRASFEAEKCYAVAFVDMRMPGGWDGLATIEVLWAIDPEIHIVICTAFSDHSWSDITERLGVSDRLLVLRKPFEKVEVLQLASALSKKWELHLQQRLDMNALEQRVQERTGALTVALAERESYSTQLQHQATHDALTGLPNRDLLRDRLQHAIAYAQRYQHHVWVAFLDLDHFKTINDMLGHKAGDSLLVTIADRLKTGLRETDTVARLGGDEFVMVLPGTNDGNLSTMMLQRLMERIEQPVQIEDREFAISCSIGISIFPADGTDPEALIDRADIAMYRAKEIGRNNIQFFTAAMNEKLQERLRLEEALKQAIKAEEFVLHYQPQLNLRTRSIDGIEALVRWQRPGIGLVGPNEFIPIAEETGLIVPLGDWVLRKACEQNKRWQVAGFKPARIAVNLSAMQLAQTDLVDRVAQALRNSGLEAKYLELEITESSVMANIEHAISVLSDLKTFGVHLSVDDFGTGYSSLAYLKKFPVDMLKIDQSFVREMIIDPDDAAIVRSIISMAQSLRLNVIAEGVETDSQLAYLRRHGCDHIQGYNFSRPVRAEEIDELLRRHEATGPAQMNSAAKQETILVIDDDVNTTTVLSMLLEQDGYRIFTASSAREGFEMMALHSVQVLLCDQYMPNMSGTEFLTKIKSMYPHTMRIILSASLDSEVLISAINHGEVYRYFTKPWNHTTIREEVRDAFDQYWRSLEEQNSGGRSDMISNSSAR